MIIFYTYDFFLPRRQIILRNDYRTAYSTINNRCIIFFFILVSQRESKDKGNFFLFTTYAIFIKKKPLLTLNINELRFHVSFNFKFCQ